MLHTSWSSLRCNLLAFKQHWEFKQQRKGFSILSTQQSEQETHLDPISKITAFQISKISRQPDSLVTQDMITEHSVPTHSKSTFACWIRISNWLCSHAKTSSWTGRWSSWSSTAVALPWSWLPHIMAIDYCFFKQIDRTYLKLGDDPNLAGLGPWFEEAHNHSPFHQSCPSAPSSPVDWNVSKHGYGSHLGGNLDGFRKSDRQIVVPISLQCSENIIFCAPRLQNSFFAQDIRPVKTFRTSTKYGPVLLKLQLSLAYLILHASENWWQADKKMWRIKMVM